MCVDIVDEINNVFINSLELVAVRLLIFDTVEFVDHLVNI